MSDVPENWIELADAGREAWWALSASEREDLLCEVRFEQIRDANIIEESTDE